MATERSKRLSPCAEQARRFDRDRFVCALFAPADRREDLYALYAFNQELAKVRETVREPLLGQMRLQWWRETLAACAAGRPPDHPVARALSVAIRRHGLATAQLERLIDARGRMLDDWPPADLEALAARAEECEAPLGLLALRVLDADTAPAQAAARQVGVAWALTGWLRAAAHDAAQGRAAFPVGLLAAEGLSAADPGRRRRPEAVARIAGQIAARAAIHLAAARAEAAAIPAAARPALLPAVLAEAYLARLRRAGNDPWHRSFAGGRPAGRARLLWRALRGGY